MGKGFYTANRTASVCSAAGRNDYENVEPHQMGPALWDFMGKPRGLQLTSGARRDLECLP